MVSQGDDLKRAALVALALMIVLAGPLLLGLPVAYSLVGIIAGLALLPSWISARAGRFDALEIIHPVVFLYVAYFGIRAIYVLTSGVADPSRPDFSDVLTSGLVYVVVGMLALLAGYYSPWGSRAGAAIAIAPSASMRGAALGAGGLVLVGFACRAWIYSNGSYTRFLATHRDASSGVMMMVDFAGWASYYGFLLAAALSWDPSASRGYRLFVWTVLAPVTFAMAFLGGAKTDIIALAIGILLGRHYLAQPVRGVALVATGVAICCIFPLVNQYRTLSGSNLDLAPHQVVALLPETLGTDEGEESFFATTGQSLMERVPGIDALSLVLKYTPDVMPFQHGRTIVIAPLIALVPTMVWPGKYDYINSVVNGVNFGTDYFGIADNTSGVAITQIAELYLNFGPIGVPLGMFVIGMLCRMAYVWFLERGRTPAGLLLYAFAYVHLIFIEGWFATTYSNLLKHLLVTAVVAWVCARLDSDRAPVSAERVWQAS